MFSGYFQKEVVHVNQVFPSIFSMKDLQNKTRLHFKMRGFGYLHFSDTRSTHVWRFMVWIFNRDVAIYPTPHYRVIRRFYWNAASLQDFWITWAEDGWIKVGSGTVIGRNVIVEHEDNRLDLRDIRYLRLNSYSGQNSWLHLENGG